jgi:D-xylose transport system substrate-binding protein
MTSSIGRRGLAVAGGLMAAVTIAACSSGSNSGGAGGGSAVAFLMPDTGSTRYELHDRPGFEKRLKELCPDCTPLYNNADGSADKQQQQFNSAVAQAPRSS